MGSLVIQAGAGTGKTHRLVELCVELLGGAEPLPPARLWAVTFTEKAAAELKGRLRRRVDALAAGEPHMRDPAFWRRVRRDLGLAQVGTIHGLCAQILRRHAAAAGIDPGFQLLDEAQARRILREACEADSLRALEGALGPERERAARRLCAEMGFRGQSKFGGGGLADELAALLSALGESGRAPQPVEEARCLEADARARDDLRLAMASLEAALSNGGATKTALNAADAVVAFRGAALAHAPGELARDWPSLRGAYEKVCGRTGGALAESVAAAKAAFEALLEGDAGVRAARLARDLALVAASARERYRAAKARAGALDFDDLTRKCCNLMTGDAPALEAERARIGALLVDEFQDTSRAQLELFERLDQGSLVLVGDRKQSIYEFRGADVAGAQAFAARLLERGAARRVLRESRRSRPALVEFANLLFARALSASGRPFDATFTPQDALTAFRPAGPAGACAELLDVSGAGVEAEAEAVARRLAALLAPVAPERVFGPGETPRPIRGGDVAILLRRTTNLEAFRRALLRRRIPHLVYKGRGFHETREVLDLLALLTLAVDPDDALALAAVLRSPLGPVSDDGLVLLARGRGLDRRSLGDLSGLAPDDAETAHRVAQLLAQLRHEVDRLGPAALLEAVLAETDYVARIAGGLYGEQAAANVDKLVALARAAELRGEGVRPFLASLRDLAEEEAREPEAAVVEERDPHAVRLLTVHAAKGLEFPVVFVPECASPAAQAGAERVLLDPEMGMAVKARAADGARRWGPLGAAVRERRQERELAQSRRLLYVAVTRARDLVVLSGRAPQKQESWRRWVDEAAPEAVERGLMRVLPEGGPAPAAARPERAPLDPAEPLPADAEKDERVRRVESRAAGAQPTVSATVTHVADALACRRRYQLLHELRLEERPGAEPDLPDALDTEPHRPAAALGTLAHRLLELLPLQLGAAARRAELEQLVALEGEDPARNAEVLDAACAFLDSPLGRRMAAARPERLQRELPFTLRLADAPGPELLLRGQIDALLLDDGAATVVDYKLSQARDAETYAAQLDAYALAAHELVGGSVPVRTGIVFLRSKGAPFAERPPPDTAALAQIRKRLLGAARAIADGRATGAWPKVEEARCRALECGFIRRCHPSAE